MQKTPRELTQGFYSPEKNGITQGLLGKFATCRFMALWFLKGWSVKSPSFPLTFGSITHGVLEKIYEDIRLRKLISSPSEMQVKNYIQKIEKIWISENPKADKKALEFFELSLLIAEATLPTYFDFWKKDIKEIKWEKIEGAFNVPFELRDGRKTFLRGKMDGVYTNPGRWLMETKTKGQIIEDQLVDYLSFELQNMFYLKALQMQGGATPKGILYNIIRRTGLRQGKVESITEYAARIAEDIKTRPDFYFIRLEISITKDELESFNDELHDMIKDFYDWFDGKSGHWRNSAACESKYGRCEYLSAENNHMTGYEKRKVVYYELEAI